MGGIVDSGRLSAGRAVGARHRRPAVGCALAGVLILATAGCVSSVEGRAEPALTLPVPPSPRPIPGPTPTPTPPPTPVPFDDPIADQPVTFGGVGDAFVGDSLDQVAEDLGLEFEAPPEDVGTDCFLSVDTSQMLAVIHTSQLIAQVFIVFSPNVELEQLAGVPVGVGSTVDEVRAAFDQYAGSDDYLSRAGGERIVVLPPGLAGPEGQRSAGLGALFEADPSGVVRIMRVGNAAAVSHVDWCTTPG
jgi:hypothetical protein